MGVTSKNRSLFLKGFNTSLQGNYEDPTYLGFKFVFDFGGLPVDNFGIPPSPLFRDTNYSFDNNSFFGTNPFGQPTYDIIKEKEKIAYYSAQTYLEEREADFNPSTVISQGLDLFGIDSNSSFGKVASGISDKIGGNGGKRADMLRQFKVLLQNINKNSPWFFQSIEGLDELAAVAREDYNAKDPTDFSAQRTGNKVLTINCLESMNLRMSALADLYRIATFDAEYMRELLPRNLRYFKMFIFVSEIREINKTARLSGSAAAVKAVEDLGSLLGSNLNPGTSSTLNNLTGGLNKVFPGGSTPGGSFNSFVGDLAQQSGLSTNYDLLKEGSEQSGIKPVLMFECSQCEFDFDNSYPIKSILDVGVGPADQATQAFRIHVGRVKVKNQYPNIRLDGLPLVLSDGWDSYRSSVQKVPRFNKDFGADLLGIGADLATNFVSHAIGDLITEGVANLASSVSGTPVQRFENVYNFSTAQDFLEESNAYFDGSNPQEEGFGGPPDRNYTRPEGDAYPRVPGRDLGVPDRVYPEPKGDSYPEVPGADLGVPGRVYPKPSGDAYPGVPGPDLGVPDRVYRKPVGDAYPGVPGQDLGVPGRVYKEPTGDAYENSPGNDLGVPDRVYKKPGGDVYRTSPGTDLGVPDRRYKEPKGDVYGTVPGRDLGVPDRKYDGPSEKVYSTTVSGNDLGNTVVYTKTTSESSGSGNEKVYQESLQKETGGLGGVYPRTSSVRSTNPSEDLGNVKGPNKFNISLGDFNSPEERFDEEETE